ncbi:DNA polymerase/3'-5' exonuclease PolX [Candidatus Woesearchaeota archaeon]|nr:DNA polymerase/3'-5' exonuclease PolX [Candidatus Woesearchaeota archaeon]
MNKQISAMFYEMADILDFLKILWKPVAYRRAAMNISGLGRDLGEMYNEKGLRALQEIPGVGKAIAKKIEEYIKTGRMREYSELQRKMPKGLLELMNIPGLGARKAQVLYKQLKIKSISNLRNAIEQHKVCAVSGFGEKSEQNILKGLDILKRKGERILLSEAVPIAEMLANALKTVEGVETVDIAGSVRRRKETVKDIDILAISSSSTVIDAFCSMANVKEVIAKGPTKASVFLNEGIACDLRVIPKKSYGAAMNYFIGSKEHNIALRKIAIQKGYKLSEYGLFSRKTGKFIAGRTEEELYKTLGMQYIEPELREARGEIETAQKCKLPEIITMQDIKADIQMHTTFSDGNNTVEEMAARAGKCLQYIAITDHYGKLKIANALDAKRFQRYSKAIDSARKKNSITILKGLEVDMDKEGRIECEASVLKQLDFCIASVHRAFTMSKEEMTKRICRAMENPFVHCIGHPTGRVIFKRDGYAIDFSKICEKAVQTSTALEINAYPERTDLDFGMIRKAIESGVKLVIGTDSHNIDDLRFLEYGVANARRGWCEKKNVLNCLPVNKFLKEIKH